MKNFTFWVFLVLFSFVIISSASLQKRNCSKKCPCKLASASFDDHRVFGYVVFVQDECGDTTVTGFFSRGLDNPSEHNYAYRIKDHCGNIIQDLGDLGITYDNNGGTKPFSKKFNFDLNCTKQGILSTKSAHYKHKRNCQYHKRQDGDESGFVMEVSDGVASSADIEF